MMTIKETITSVSTRRESITYTCKKKTIYLLKRIPSTIGKKYSKCKAPADKKTEEVIDVKKQEDIEENSFRMKEEDEGISVSPEDNYRELDYYLGYKTGEDTCWRDPIAEEILRRDFYIRHCDVSEVDYNRTFKSSAIALTDVSCSTASLSNSRKVPLRRYRRRLRKSQYDAERDRSKKRNKKKKYERRGYLKFMTKRKDYEESTDSSSDMEMTNRHTERQGSSCETILKSSQDGLSDAHVTFSEATTVCLPNIDTDNSDEIRRLSVQSSSSGVLIREIDEGQPCDNCPELCGGFIPHSWRKTCKACGCERTEHAVYHEEACDARARLGLRDETNTQTTASPAQLDWAPPGLNAKQAETYFSMLPGPETASAVARRRWRARALATQLPRQDLAAEHNKHLSDKHRADYEDFVAARNEIALDIGHAVQHHGASSDCPTCQKPVRPGTIAVIAPKISEETLYHPGCFTCSTCQQLLVELAYCALDGRAYCERHYAETLKPRCAACDELIFSGEYTKAMNKDWHSGHFCCWQCDESLTGQRYVLREEHPYCIKCYESVFANGCEECSKIIGIDSKDLSYKDKHWHEACFLCAKCRVSLVDKQFGSKLDKIYCGNCYDAQFASRCDGCGEVFRAGTKKMEYKTRQWHEKCFCCVVCKNAIGTKSFIPREQEIYCAGCYEDKFATRCVKCTKIITQGGVTYKNEPWHRECFTCTNCSTSLAGQRFTSRDEKPYCAECFGELFAKRCTACVKPITGIGGTRFISFEDRHWHNDCFFCATCKTTLVGRGFIIDSDDIICPECAKKKLL